MLADYHVHTYYSDDSECPMEDMVRRGIELGLNEIAFTEHVDYGVKTDLNCDYKRYFEELERLQEKYRDRITIRKGIEVNTSCFAYGLADLTPSRRILELYRQMGGRIVTIGSDAHDAVRLGDHVQEVKRILKEIGFSGFCTFENMEPVYRSL